VIDSVVLGAIAAIAAIGFDLDTAAVVAIGVGFFFVALTGFVTWGRRQIARGKRTLEPLFPTPPAKAG
jgi:hypothetical protein